MESELKLKKARDEVMRKIGRNVILFQQMELRLKHIISEYRFSGFTNEIVEKMTKKRATVSKQTMGQLIEEFLENVYSENKPLIPESMNPKDLHWTFDIKVGPDKTLYEEKKQTLKKIVKNRNDLIHHFLPEFNPNSMESCLKTDQYLDQQRDKFQPVNDRLEKLLLAGEQGKKILFNYIESGKFIENFKLLRLRQSRIVILLAEIASRKARPDGWTLLNTAGKITHEEEPAEMDAIKKKIILKR